jgi:SAM-dependent methyltransferase
MSYEPERYWDARLAGQCNLRGTGNLGHSERYNRWLYRRKAEALRDALGVDAVSGRVLDVGSGIGWVIRQLMSAGAEDITGIDIARSAIHRLRQEFPTCSFEQFAIGQGRLHADDDSFDLITMVDVAYHIVEPDAFRSAIAEIGRLLAPSGRLVFTDELGPTDRSPAAHVRFRGLETWHGALEGAGLQITRVGSLYAWLSRDRGTIWDRLPDGVQGPLEYLLEHIGWRKPHLRWAVARAG